MDNFYWDPEPLQHLIRKNYGSLQRFHAVSPSNYREIMDMLEGKETPSPSQLVALADHFNASVDYILGHKSPGMTKELTKQVDLCNDVRDAQELDSEVDWPYNLVADLLNHPVTYELTEDNEKGIEYAINTLEDEREAHIVYRRCKEKKGFREIAVEYGVTTSRVRQIYLRALRKLRHPVKLRYILYGYEYYQKYNAVQDRISSLESQIENLHTIEKQCNDLEKNVIGMKTKLRNVFAAELGLDIPNSYRQKLNEPIQVLDLSIRSYNCLRRAGRTTIGDVAKMTEEELFRVRDLGSRSRAEVIQKVYDYTGIDIRKNVASK